MIGIIGAMEIEIEKIVSKMEKKEEKTVSGITFTKGFIGKNAVVALFAAWARCLRPFAYKR